MKAAARTVSVRTAPPTDGPLASRHTRGEPGAQGAAVETGHTPLSIEGSFRNPAGDVAWEYSVVVAIRDDKGKEIARKLIGVGALKPEEVRSFSLSVEMAPAKGKSTPMRSAAVKTQAPAPPKPASPGSPMRGGGLRR